MKSNILLTICARGGSKGVKGKNFRLLQGKPLIAYTIEQALKWGKASHVVVSTDSEEIASIAKKYGAEVPFKRPEELATDTAGKLPVIRHAINECERIYNEEYPIIIDLDPTSPVRTPDDIEKAFLHFIKTGATTLFSVVASHKSPYFNMVERDKNGNVVLSKTPDHPILCRQDAPAVYDMNASIYIFKREYIINPAVLSPISNHCEIYCMNDWTSIDIDREIDFRFIEFLVQENIISL